MYMALHEWRKARHFLGVVMSMPVVNSVSFVMVEAYKKWVLVGLLDKGKVSEIRGQQRKEMAEHIHSFKREKDHGTYIVFVD